MVPWHRLDGHLSPSPPLCSFMPPPKLSFLSVDRPTMHAEPSSSFHVFLLCNAQRIWISDLSNLQVRIIFLPSALVVAYGFRIMDSDCISSRDKRNRTISSKDKRNRTYGNKGDIGLHKEQKNLHTNPKTICTCSNFISLDCALSNEMKLARSTYNARQSNSNWCTFACYVVIILVNKYQ